MISIIALLVLFFLIAISFVDIKFKEIPSIFLTGMIFLTLFFQYNSLQFGLLALLLAIMLYEGDFIKGMADVKMISLAGLMISSLFWFGIFVILLMFFGISTKLFLSYRQLNKKRPSKTDEFPFIPIIALSYIVLLFAGGIA